MRFWRSIIQYFFAFSALIAMLMPAYLAAPAADFDLYNEGSASAVDGDNP